MPHPGIAADLRELIYVLVQNDLKSSAGKIRVSLRARGIQEHNLPSERTIARIKKEFLNRTVDQRRPYSYLHWPESMLDGSLPWESSSAMCELLNCYRRWDYGLRPTILVSQWFWWLTLAAPGLNSEKRFKYARCCAFLDASKLEGGFRGMEAYLMLTPWHSKAAHELWRKLVDEGKIPDVPRTELDEYPQLKTTRVVPQVSLEDIKQARAVADRRRKLEAKTQESSKIKKEKKR